MPDAMQRGISTRIAATGSAALAGGIFHSDRPLDGRANNHQFCRLRAVGASPPGL
jgi:hypothetical protein